VESVESMQYGEVPIGGMLEWMIAYGKH
jgi:hypothetical protein